MKGNRIALSLAAGLLGILALDMGSLGQAVPSDNAEPVFQDTFRMPVRDLKPQGVNDYACSCPWSAAVY